jgi:hypothetical protein
MKDSKSFIPKDDSPVKISEEGFWPSWIFQHKNLFNSLETAQVLEQEKLINKLNYIHFMNDHVLLLLRHSKYNDSILITSRTEPCIDNVLTCYWDKNHRDFNLDNYHFQYLIIQEDHSIILVPAILQEANDKNITLRLPENSFVLSHRRIQRFTCRDVMAELMQSGFAARGQLMDFSPEAFRIKFTTEKSPSFHCYNTKVPSIVRLSSNGTIFFSEGCHFVRQEQKTSWREIVFSPISDHINRFQTKKIRNPRQQISPPLMAEFEHPFFKKRIHRQIFDISITGFSVHDKIDEGILMPGLIIPHLSINYAGSLKMDCTAQVVYRRVEGTDVCCGFAILDMGILSYSRLNHILSTNTDTHAYISTEVDIDALWELFFETGFIYPKKYNSIHSYREDFKETYRKLYREDSEIARHFTYEKNGRIYGHLSMVKAYERAWLIHHHAARPMENKLPGFQVLKHITLFAHGICQFPSAKMDYVMCYFRPENTFPDRIFGGFSRKLNTPEVCSLDLFSYLTYNAGLSQNPMPDDWLLKEISPSEIQELEHFYHHHSGGLFLKVLGRDSDPLPGESIENVSARHGFLRKWRIYSLIYRKNLSAVLIANQSSLGINLSELLNSITIMVIDPESVPWECLSLAVEQLSQHYQLDKVPLLIYPPVYVEAKSIPIEKQYQLWILDTNYINEFMQFTQRRFRMKYD